MLIMNGLQFCGALIPRNLGIFLEKSLSSVDFSALAVTVLPE